MPIELEFPITRYDQKQFHAIDRRVMGIVFDVHNEFGRFVEELLYKREIAARCLAAGFHVRREYWIRLTHDSFEKFYYADLLVNCGVVYEVKTVETLAPAHRAQTLNYVLLTETQHGRLVNLRTEFVQYEFSSTSLTPEERRRFSAVDTDWTPESDECRWFHQTMLDLLNDWGAFLEVPLYRDAITHFLGGKERVLRPVPFFSGSQAIGEQDVHLLRDDTAFAITALTGDKRLIRDHQQKFLDHTPLRCIAWVNLNHHDIEFETLYRTPKAGRTRC